MCLRPIGDSLRLSFLNPSGTSERRGGGSVTQSSDGRLVYTPPLDLVGQDFFSYVVTDGTELESVGAVTGTVLEPDNLAPVAVDDSAETEANTPVSIDVLINDSDPDGDPVAISVVYPPSNGSAIATSGGTQITYTPNLGFDGSDSFSYAITDGNGGVASAHVNVTVTAPPPPPLTLDVVSLSRSELSAQEPFFKRDVANVFVVVEIHRVAVSGSVDGTVTVTYSTVDGSAEAGGDYHAAGGTVHWEPGDYSVREITVQILYDDLSESNEDFFIRLSAPVNATLGNPEEATVTIEDNGLD